MAGGRGKQKQNAARGSIEPKASRPVMPESYEICSASKGSFLPWSKVEKRMSAARNYWIGTTRPDGRPHLMPVWGVWVNQAFYFSTDRRTRKARNLAANPALVVHLESGDDVVILEGVAREIADSALLKQIDDAYHRKYRMRVLGMPGEIVFYTLKPRVAFAWQEKTFPQNATRWIFQ
jgi:hypothetical protein